MKRFLALFLIVILNSTMTVSARQVEIPENWEGLPTVQDTCCCQEHLDQTALLIPGDLNKDNDISARDALLVLQCATNPLAPYNRFTAGNACLTTYVADLNNDQQINAVDALYILRYAVKTLDSFPVGPAIPDVTFAQPPSGFGSAFS